MVSKIVKTGNYGMICQESPRTSELDERTPSNGITHSQPEELHFGLIVLT